MGLQVQMAVHKEVEAQTAQLHPELERMKVSPPTHSSSLHNCTVIHHGTDVLSNIHITILYVLHCDSNNWNCCVFKLQTAVA